MTTIMMTTITTKAIFEANLYDNYYHHDNKIIIIDNGFNNHDYIDNLPNNDDGNNN